MASFLDPGPMSLNVTVCDVVSTPVTEISFPGGQFPGLLGEEQRYGTGPAGVVGLPDETGVTREHAGLTRIDSGILLVTVVLDVLHTDQMRHFRYDCFDGTSLIETIR